MFTQEDPQVLGQIHKLWEVDRSALVMVKLWKEFPWFPSPFTELKSIFLILLDFNFLLVEVRLFFEELSEMSCKNRIEGAEVEGETREAFDISNG